MSRPLRIYINARTYICLWGAGLLDEGLGGAEEDAVVAVDVGMEVEVVGDGVGIGGVVDDEEGDVGLDVVVGEQPQWALDGFSIAFAFAEVFQVVASAFGLRRLVHREAQAVEGPFVGIGQQETGEFEGLLNADAAVGEGAALALEGGGVVGVVEVDGEVVGEAEDDAAEAVARAAELGYAHSPGQHLVGSDSGGSEGVARGPVDDEITVAREVGGVAGVAGDIGLDDVLGDNPFGIHLHVFEGAVEEGGLGECAAAADAHGEDAVWPDGPQLLGGEVDDGGLWPLPAASFEVDGEFAAEFFAGGGVDGCAQGFADGSCGAGVAKVVHAVVGE